jgi:hypothetical protein
MAAGAAACLSTACTGDPSSPSPGGGSTPQLTAPVLDAPGDDGQLTTLRPTLVVRNGSSSTAGTRTYEFQISTSSSFSPVAATRSGIAENASGKTSYTPDADLQSTTRYPVTGTLQHRTSPISVRMKRRWAGRTAPSRVSRFGTFG